MPATLQLSTSTSKVSVKKVLLVGGNHSYGVLLGVELNWDTRTHLIVGYEDHKSKVCLVKKLMYFVHMDHNPMNSNPKFTTSW